MADKQHKKDSKLRKKTQKNTSTPAVTQAHSNTPNKTH